MIKVIDEKEQLSYQVGNILGFGFGLCIFASLLFLFNRRWFHVLTNIPYSLYILTIALIYLIIVAFTLKQKSAKIAENVVN